MLAKVKAAMRVPSDTFDGEIRDLILAGKDDLAVAGVIGNDIENGSVEIEDPLILRAVITYCKMHWNGFASQHDALKKSYDEQKAQLSMHTGTTNWG